MKIALSYTFIFVLSSLLMQCTYCTVVSVSCNSSMLCPYEILTYTCTVENAAWIKWGYKEGDDFNGVLLSSSQDVNYSLSDYGLAITLISKTTNSLTATVEFNVTTSLNNTYMLCDDDLLGKPELGDGCYISLSSFNPPNAPTVTVQELSSNSVKLNWTSIGNSQCIKSYEVTLNGEVYANINKTSVIITGLEGNEDNNITVTPIDNINRKGESYETVVHASVLPTNPQPSFIASTGTMSRPSFTASTGTTNIAYSSSTSANRPSPTTDPSRTDPTDDRPSSAQQHGGSIQYYSMILAGVFLVLLSY